jgi:hypothetical protein
VIQILSLGSQTWGEKNGAVDVAFSLVLASWYSFSLASMCGNLLHPYLSSKGQNGETMFPLFASLCSGFFSSGFSISVLQMFCSGVARASHQPCLLVCCVGVIRRWLCRYCGPTRDWRAIL